MARLSRGLALMLIVFGGLFAGLGEWLSVSQGAATTSFEAIRRFAAALDAQDPSLAASLGANAIQMASADQRWDASARAELAYRLANANVSLGRTGEALRFARIASEDIGKAPNANIDLAINVARLHGDLALTAGDKLEAACTYGLLLERLGPDRIEHPEARVRPHPALAMLTDHLISLGKSFSAARPAGASQPGQPLTSCNLSADFFAERNDYAAAASISDAVLKQARTDKTLGPEILAALLQDASRIAELNGQIDVAKSRAQEAVEILPGDGLAAPRAVALERLAMLHSNWSDAKGAEPYLQEAIQIRQKVNGADSPELISPLLTLGYARLDNKDASAAESLFKRALTIAEAQPSKDRAPSLEATLALAELYDDENRPSEAAQMHGKAALMQKAGVTLHSADVEDLPIDQPAARKRLALFSIAYENTAHHGHIEVALDAPLDADWIGGWPASTFTPASENFGTPLVYAPHDTAPGRVADKDAPNVLFIPGQGTDLSLNARRLARLQAFLGPAAKSLLIDWADGDAVTESLRNPNAEAGAIRVVSSTLSREADTRAERPLTIVAEGRGAFIALAAIEKVSAAQRERIGLQRLILIAPDVDEALFVQKLGLTGISRRTIVYVEPNARPLLASKINYGTQPIGLDAAQLAHLENIETVEIQGNGGMDFDAAWSDALIGDIARAFNGIAPSARCGITPLEAPRLFRLNAAGCTASAS